MTGTARVARTAAAALGMAAATHLAPGLLGIPGAPSRLRGLTGPGRPGWVGLTFDDGPHPDGTPAVMDQLARTGVTATFFMMGEQLQRHPGLGRWAVEAGHELAVHGWNHRPLPGRRPGQISGELTATCELITAVAGAAPRWYRPPYGVATGEALWAARRLGLRPVWWHRWGRDWRARATPAGIARAVIGPPHRPRLHGGNVILLHDADTYSTPGSWRSTAAALPAILGYAAEQGLRVSALDGAPAAADVHRCARRWRPGCPPADRRTVRRGARA